MIYQAVLTETGAAKFAKYPGGISGFLRTISFFRLGEGGWIQSGPTRVPRVPDPTLTDLDIKLDPGRAAPNRRYDVGESFGYFEKSLLAEDFQFIVPSTLRVFPYITTTEYNYKDDPPPAHLVYSPVPAHVSPHIFEIGLYDLDGDMVIYATVPEEIKDSTRQVENPIRIAYQAG
jgi:hypothetical protein